MPPKGRAVVRRFDRTIGALQTAANAGGIGTRAADAQEEEDDSDYILEDEEEESEDDDDEEDGEYVDEDDEGKEDEVVDSQQLVNTWRTIFQSPDKSKLARERKKRSRHDLDGIAVRRKKSRHSINDPKSVTPEARVLQYENEPLVIYIRYIFLLVTTHVGQS